MIMFNRKLKLFRLFGFEVGIDATWIVLAVLVAWSLSTGYFPYKYQALSSGAYWAMGIGGKMVQIGIHPADQITELPLTWLPPQCKSIEGTLYGNIRTHEDIPTNGLSSKKNVTGCWRVRSCSAEKTCE